MANSPRHARSRAWAPFTTALAQTLAILEAGQFLVLERSETPWFVQFAAQGVYGLRAEVVSNAYLAPDDQLPPAALHRMGELGWQPPTESPTESTPDSDPDGSPNSFMEWQVPVPHKKVAALTVETLIEVLAVSHPADLRYKAFTDAGTQILLPALGRRSPHADEETPAPTSGADDHDSVARAVLAIMRDVNGDPDLEPDSDGDIGVRFGSGAAFVSVRGEPPIIRVFSPVLIGITPNAGLDERLNELNLGMSFVKWLHTDEAVFATIDLFGLPLTREHVLAASQLLGTAIDGVDDALQAEFGGRTFFGETAPPKPTLESGGYL